MSDDTEADSTSDGEEPDPRAHFGTKKRLFLEAYAKEGNIMAAARRAGVGRRSHYNWLKSDPEYPLAFHDAEEDYADSMEAEADRRARDGYDKPVFYKGEECGKVREYSDSLLALRLKSLRPEKYRDKAPTNEAVEDQQRREVLEMQQEAVAAMRERANDPVYVEFARQMLLEKDYGTEGVGLHPSIARIRAKLDDPEYQEFLAWKQEQLKTSLRTEHPPGSADTVGLQS